MIQKNQTLNDWALENPTVNPFTDCLNITTYGGAKLFYDEFLYRYGEREIFKPTQFVSAVERIFTLNSYKYTRLYQTTVLPYDIFTNYKVQKSGSETNTINMQKTGTGQSTRTPTLTETTTPNLSQTETFTPTIKSRETTTPTLKTKETVTPTVKSQETDAIGVSTTTTSTPDSYTELTSRTTYDDANYKPVESMSHTGVAGGTSTTTPSGSNVKTTEVLSGNTITENEVVSGNTIKETETLSGNNTTLRTSTGTTQKSMSGTDTTQSSNSDTNTGTEVLSFTDRIDEGYMYREPQNAIRDERDIAMFAMLDTILTDVERATLLSIY